MDKLIAKMGDVGRDPVLADIKSYITKRESSGMRESHPSRILTRFLGVFLRFHSKVGLPQEALFAVVDLLRICLIDPTGQRILRGGKGAQDPSSRFLQAVNDSFSRGMPLQPAAGDGADGLQFIQAATYILIILSHAHR